MINYRSRGRGFGEESDSALARMYMDSAKMVAVTYPHFSKNLSIFRACFRIPLTTKLYAEKKGLSRRPSQDPKESPESGGAGGEEGEKKVEFNNNSMLIPLPRTQNAAFFFQRIIESTVTKSQQTQEYVSFGTIFSIYKFLHIHSQLEAPLLFPTTASPKMEILLSNSYGIEPKQNRGKRFYGLRLADNLFLEIAAFNSIDAEDSTSLEKANYLYLKALLYYSLYLSPKDLTLFLGSIPSPHTLKAQIDAYENSPEQTTFKKTKLITSTENVARSKVDLSHPYVNAPPGSDEIIMRFSQNTKMYSIDDDSELAPEDQALADLNLEDSELKRLMDVRFQYGMKAGDRVDLIIQEALRSGEMEVKLKAITSAKKSVASLVARAKKLEQERKV